MRLLFVCGRNRRRSPTAEEIFAAVPSLEVCSAGVSPDADSPLSGELIEWADVIFVMEPGHRQKLSRKFSACLKRKRVVCLSIPDIYEYMDPKLVRLLWDRVPRSIPGLAAARPSL